MTRYRIFKKQKILNSAVECFEYRDFETLWIRNILMPLLVLTMKRIFKKNIYLDNLL